MASVIRIFSRLLTAIAFSAITVGVMYLLVAFLMWSWWPEHPARQEEAWLVTRVAALVAFLYSFLFVLGDNEEGGIVDNIDEWIKNGMKG